MNIRKKHAQKHSIAAVGAAFLATCLGLPVNAATSFPPYPLQTGTGSIPPNIMFILDDSASMGWDFMPGAYNNDRYAINQRTTPINFGLATYIHNKLYYNPNVPYQPWMQADGTRSTGGTTLDSVYTDGTRLQGAQDLSQDVHTFYVPKPGATDLSNSHQYYRYQIRRVADDGVTGARVVRSDYAIATNDNQGMVGAGCGVDASDLGKLAWRNCEFSVPVLNPASRTEAAEISNFATWYSYHRTRSKVAKAGASEAFGELGENFRVGYDSIWNRNGGAGVAGDAPAFRIPVGTDEGLFKGQNKKDWFDYLYRAIGSSGTPLHGALRRTGSYYENDTADSGPWGPQSGAAQLSCRQNYAILTTDGYWNDASGYSSVGNTDGTAGAEIVAADGEKTFTYAPKRPYSDDASNTLADIAMHYWKRDLRSNLANNVPTSNANEAFWQHMVTFGISIGLEGTLKPSDVQLIEAGDKSWPNPWQTSSNSTNSWSNESNRRIDDLMHAAVNARGEFVAATDPQAFSDALKASLAAIVRQKASGSNVASNGPSLNSGSHLFQATYTSGEWSGDVVGISIVGGNIAGTPTWSATAKANEDAAAYRARGVYTWSGSAGATFPTSAQEGLLARNTGLAQVSGSDNAAYIKGTRTLEGTSTGKLRKRSSPIGDIVNSSPFYVKESDSVYIGANDGMLHGINAKTGVTHFSYLPAGLDFANLASLSNPDYQHQFFVDGGIDVTTTDQGQGRNILVGVLGRGGKGAFALDVTSPNTFSASSVLWDRTFTSDSSSAADADMGHVLGAPLVRQGNNGKTLAIVPNGIDSKSGKAVLFIYVLSASGTIESVKKIATNAQTSNGLSEARAADVTGDGKADYIYAGDLQGNVWKFDVSGTNTSQWGVAYKSGSTPMPMFSAKDAAGNPQPITSAVALAREPTTSRIFVLFGTGRYITNGDLSDTATQSVYALVDDEARITTRNDLQLRTIPYTGEDALGRAARSWESYSPLTSGKRGWFVDLGIPTAGERVVTAPFVRGRALWFSSIIPQPGSGCDSGGTGYLNAVDVFTGTNPRNANGTYTFIDVNSDGVGNDKLAGAAEGEPGFVTSVDLGIGMPAQGVGVGNNIFVCGSEAECGGVPTPPPGDGPKRLNWRELYNRD